MSDDDYWWDKAKAIVEEHTRLAAMRASRDRWRSAALKLANELEKLPRLLEAEIALFEVTDLLNDPFDGDGIFRGRGINRGE